MVWARQGNLDNLDAQHQGNLDRHHQGNLDMKRLRWISVCFFLIVDLNPGRLNMAPENTPVLKGKIISQAFPDHYFRVI